MVVRALAATAASASSLWNSIVVDSIGVEREVLDDKICQLTNHLRIMYHIVLRRRRAMVLNPACDLDALAVMFSSVELRLQYRVPPATL
jgi:hypothetical protein